MASKETAPKLKIRQSLDEPPKGKPFHHDKLGRDIVAENLERLLRNTESPFTIAIDAPYGTGKSAFLSMWNTQLQANGFKTVFVDAWKTDFTGDPFVAIVDSLREVFPKPTAGYVEALNSLRRNFLPLAFKVTLKAIVGWAKLEGVAETLSNELADAVEQSVEEALQESKSLVGCVDAFRRELSACAKKLGDLPLVILVDELDRCRPTYAIEMLERIKHFFDVPGITFVLATNNDQLANSVKAVYGSGFDGVKYLERFVDLTYRLPRPHPDTHGHEFVESTIKELKLEREDKRILNGCNRRSAREFSEPRKSR